MDKEPRGGFPSKGEVEKADTFDVAGVDLTREEVMSLQAEIGPHLDQITQILEATDKGPKFAGKHVGTILTGLFRITKINS